ncbi:MAG: hypothetical protein K2X87_23210, partial [Gemmataceae bacterium]|nr:hypothetical protein [Gemmataceae bacterium]
AGLAAAATGLRRPAPAPATPPRRPTIPFPSEDPTVTKTLAWLIVFAWLALLVVLAVAFGLAFAHWQRHPLLSALLPAALGLLVGGYLAGGIVAALARSLGVVWSHPSLPSAVAGVLLGWYSPDDGEEGE